MPLNDKEISKEAKGKIRQLYRLLLSSSDFKQAAYTASYILDTELHENEDRRLLESLNCSMIIAYCRPYSGNDKNTKLKIPDLSYSFLKGFPKDEKEIHKLALSDRNTIIAHSDSVASYLEPEVWSIHGEKMLMPYRDDTKAPFTKEVTKVFLSLANRSYEHVIMKRRKLEPELFQYFKETDIEDIINNNV